MELNGHRVILIRDMQSLDKAIMSVDDYLMIASADHGKMFKSNIYNAIKVYMLELQPVDPGKIRDNDGNLIENPDELPTKVINYGQYSYRVEATDITAANLDKITGYGLKISEECYGRGEDTKLYPLDSCYSEDGSPNPDLKDGYKTKTLDWDWFESGKTDGTQSTISKNMEYSFITQEEIEITDENGQTITETKNIYNTESIFERRMTIIDGLFKTINRGWGSLFRFVNYKNNTLTQTMYGQPAYANFSLGEMEILQHEKQFDINDKNPSAWVNFSDIGENYFGGITRGLPGDGHPGYWFWDEYLGWYWFTAKTFPYIFIQSPLLSSGSLAEIDYGGTIDGNGNVVIEESRYDFIETTCTSGQDLDELERILSKVPSLGSNYNTITWIAMVNIFSELSVFNARFPLNPYTSAITSPSRSNNLLTIALQVIHFAIYLATLRTLYTQVQQARAKETECMEGQKKQGPWYDFRREWEVKFPRPCNGVYTGIYNYLVEEIVGEFILFPNNAVRYNLLRSLTDQELGNLLYISNQQLGNLNTALAYDNSLNTITNSINYVKGHSREIVVNNLLERITILNETSCQGYNGFNINEAMMDIFDKYAPVTQQGYIPAVYRKNSDGTLFEVPKNSKGEYITQEIINLDQVDSGQYRPCGWAKFGIDSSGNQRTKHVYIPEKECWSDLSYGVLVKGECTSDSIPLPSLINEYESPGKCPFGLTKEEKEQYFDRKEYTVVFSGGNGSETGANTYNRNSTVSISCLPSTGHVLREWTSNVQGLVFASKTSNSTTFTMPDSNVVITPVYDDTKIRVRDEIIALLPSVDAVINYVDYSSYFTRTQKDSIIFELALAAKSGTLNGIFNYTFIFATDYATLVRLAVRDDIIALLPSLDAVANYIRYSDYFTRAKKAEIIYEMALSKRSPTLNAMFNYTFPFVY